MKEISRGQRLASAGAMFAIAEPVLQGVLHAGPGLGVIVGLAVAGATYAYADDIARALGKGDALPSPTHPVKGDGKLPLGKRLLVGKSVREEQRIPEDVEWAVEQKPKVTHLLRDD